MTSRLWNLSVTVGLPNFRRNYDIFFFFGRQHFPSSGTWKDRVEHKLILTVFKLTSIELVYEADTELSVFTHLFLTMTC